MKWSSNISVVFLAVVFMLSATGVIVFQSHCSCTGNEKVSLYVSPETCEDNFHTHHFHLQGGEEAPSSENQCHECTSHTKECGCNDISISYLKLKNEVVVEKVRSKTNLPVAAILPDMAVSLMIPVEEVPKKTDAGYTDPPSTRTSLDFLIPLNQLKIPHCA